MTEDRWEAFGDYDDDVKFNEGVVTERSRIIALLNHEYWHNVSYLSDIHYDCLMCEAIALIKGEN